MASRELHTVLSMLRAQPKRDGELSLEELRAAFGTPAKLFRVPRDARCERVDAGGVAAEWIVAPEAAAGRVILYLHGGGYISGSIQTHKSLVARLSAASGARGLAVDYRLAPEASYPAAVEDAMTAYRWLLSGGHDPRRIVIAGDSAGGGLALATMVALRDAGDPLPGAAVCLSPWVDLEGLGSSMATNAERDPIVQPRPLRQMGRLYLAGASPRSPLAAPLYADLRGLPPLLIQVGSSEVLLDDSRRLAARAWADGVEVELDLWEDVVHVWQLFAPILPEGQQAIEQIGAFIRRRVS